MWNGVIYYNSVNVLFKGVVFLIRNDIKLNIEMVNGFDGRFLYVKYKENDNKYDIINVYVFNDVRERVMFLKNIINVMLCLIELIIMGDFNNIFVEIDRCGKIVYKYD